MSHSVSFVAFNLTQDINEQCNSILNRIKSIQQYNWKNESINQSINNLINNYSKKVDDILNMDKKLVNPVEIQSMLITITKDIANMQQFTDESINKYYQTYFDNAKQNINKIIAQYGILAITAIEQMQKNHEIINEDNLLNKIDIIRNNQINEEQLKIYKQTFKQAINASNFPNNIKLELLNYINTFKTIQEVSDIAGFIASKNDEFNKMLHLIKDVSSILKEVGFKFTNHEIKYCYDKKEGIFNTILNFKNQNNNSIAIEFNSLGKISYKLGNYIGHACEATSASILKKLKEKGYEYSVPQITRNISNAKPLAKSIDTFKERNK